MGQRSDKEKIMGYKKTAKLFNVPEGTPERYAKNTKTFLSKN